MSLGKHKIRRPIGVLLGLAMMRPTAAVLWLVTLAGLGAAFSWPGPARPARPAPVPRAGAPAGVGTPAADRAAFDAKAVYDRAIRSCVILVAPAKGGVADGIGVLIDADRRLVLTTVGVDGEAEWIFAQFPTRDQGGAVLTDKKKYIERIPAGAAIKGKVAHTDRAAGLAVVRLDKVPPDTPAMPVARESVEAGSPVVRIRHAATKAFASEAGEVRGFGIMPLGGGPLTLDVTDRTDTDKPGWPVIDSRGRLVGVTDAKRPGVVLDIKEVRTFLAEKKIELPEPKAGGEPKK